VIFLELVLQNFGPYLGRQVIDLRPKIVSVSDGGRSEGEQAEAQNTSDTTRPIILLGGMNGGGKTTLMDAIRLALYGSRAQCSTRGNLSYSDFLTQSVNRNTPPTEKARIELAFEVIENDRPLTLRVVRYWTTEPKDGKDTLGILVDEEWPDKALANTWDEYIENLLPLGISNLFLFDGEQVKELAELDTPPPIVVDAIQSLLGLELAERLSKDLDILVSRKRKEIASAKDLATLEEIEQTLHQQKDELEANTQELAALDGELQRAEEQQRQASEKFIYEGGKIASDRRSTPKPIPRTRIPGKPSASDTERLSRRCLAPSLNFTPSRPSTIPSRKRKPPYSGKNGTGCHERARQSPTRLYY
jgi:DNA sulfur modification protein DndD